MTTQSTVNAACLRAMNDPSTSRWLRVAINEALARDPVDAFNDAAMLAELLRERLVLILRGDQS